MKIQSASDIFILLGGTVAIILCCNWFFSPPPPGYNNGWSPRNYVAAEGECFVPPQGDPLYDEHYAKNVNNPNCQALVNQSQSKNIDAQTDGLEIQNTKDRLGLYAVVGILGLVVIMLFVASIKS